MVGALIGACGPTGPAEDPGDDTTSMPASTSGVDSSSSGAPADSSDATTEDPEVESSSEGSSSTGETFTFSGDEVWSERSCLDMVPAAWIELYPGHVDGECAPPVDISDDYVLIVLQPWDGMGGTFVIDEGSTSQASIGLEVERPVGEVTIDVSAPWQLAVATIELSTPTASVSGTADLATCGSTQVGDPCR